MIKAKKELGQNFLICENKIDTMVNALEITPDEHVYEIGPGTGAVTKKLLEKLIKGKYTGIELDEDMIEILQEQVLRGENSNWNLLKANVLDYLSTDNFELSGNFKILGSLPYYITSPILHKVIYMTSRPKTCVFLVQKEVAQKICSVSPDSNYLAVFIQTFFEIEYVDTVEKECFSPIPKVDGGIIELNRIDDCQIEQPKMKKYEGFLHRGFSNPRKMLNKVFAPSELEIMELKGTDRAQNVSTETWIKAFKKLKA